ncbi:MAG: polyprenyl synthetase family protein [Acidobacteria bacterium]|nr:polyprenyl synthetase family protein [Acidobacteriota bacterium]MDW7984343.1 polyprenyl synthetase family protein [Acidobacteriota bacterium]
MRGPDYWKTRVELVEAWLDQLVRPAGAELAGGLWEAMRYSLLAPAKRVRPVLLLAVGETLDVEPERFRYAACAIECIHTYSLIHDDLPAMDNDTLRRGRPTCHVQFGEGTAILAGDGLLTLAFELLGTCPFLRAHPAIGIDVVRLLARYAGPQGMVAGQWLDMHTAAPTPSVEHVLNIHRRKTAALITAAVEIGGLMVEAPPAMIEALRVYGEAVGTAFQIVDDILDLTTPPERLGKTPGKDVQASKATYPRAVGLERAWADARAFRDRAVEAIRPWDTHGLLTSLAYLITERQA